MTRKETFKQAYNDWLCICACVNGLDYNKSQSEIKEWYDKDIQVMTRSDDKELYDVNFGVCAFTINKTKNNKAWVNEQSIEVYDGLDCLGCYSVQDLMKLGGIKD